MHRFDTSEFHEAGRIIFDTDDLAIAVQRQRGTREEYRSNQECSSQKFPIIPIFINFEGLEDEESNTHLKLSMKVARPLVENCFSTGCFSLRALFGIPGFVVTGRWSGGGGQ